MCIRDRACPVDAIYPQDMVPHDFLKYIAMNADYFKASAG